MTTEQPSVASNWRPARIDPHPRTPPNPVRPISFTEAGRRRPRILITSDALQELKQRLKNPVEAEMLERQRKLLDRIDASQIPPGNRERISQRGYSFWQAPAATLYLLTGEKRYLKTAKDFTLNLVRCDPDDASGDLSASHALEALGFSYDLLHSEWTDAERAEIVNFVRRFGTAFFSITAAPINYWASILLQNHCQVAWCGIGIAGLAFHDEIEDAREWAQWAQRIYRTISWLQPPDGSNLEGPSYGAYGIEQRCMYYEAARRCLGEDLYGPGEENTVKWFMHQLLPDFRPMHNSLRWGDTPQFYDWHGPVHSLLALAARFKDPVTQGVALECWRRGIGQIRGLSFLDLLWYDPKLPEKPLDSNPTSNHFDDLDLICARSSWKPEATLVSMLCGPYQGHRTDRVAAGDLGGAHVHADSASIQVYSRGEVLLSDPGYESVKRTDHHNTVLVDGNGQMGEGLKWFNTNRVLHYNGTAEVLSFRDDGESVAWVGEAAKIYHPDLGLTRFRRHVLYMRPDLLVVLDQLQSKEPRVFTQLWHTLSELKPAGDAYGFIQGKAALSVLPLDPDRKDGQTPQVTQRLQPLKDLTDGPGKQYELRVESPRTTDWTFATVFALADAQSGIPELGGSASADEISVQSQFGDLTVKFSLDAGEPPAPK